jgi:trigger factor
MAQDTENPTEEATTTEPAGEAASAESKGLETRAEIEVIDGCRRKVYATVGADKVREQFDIGFRELGSSVVIPGFRRGRVPRRILEKRFGKEIRSDVREMLLKESFEEVVKNHALRLFGLPNFNVVQFESDADFQYDAEIVVEPSFTVPTYRGVEVDVPAVITVTDEEIDQDLDEQRQRLARAVLVEGEIAPKDFEPNWYVYGNLELWIDGERVKTSESQLLYPSSGRIGWFVIDDLPARLRDWDPTGGRMLTVPVTVPDNYPDEVLRGRNAELRYRLDRVERIQLPELDDAFAIQLGCENVASLRAQLRSAIESQKRREHDETVAKTIVDKLVEQTNIDLSDDAVRAFESRISAARESLEESELLDEDSGEDSSSSTSVVGEAVTSDGDDALGESASGHAHSHEHGHEHEHSHAHGHEHAHDHEHSHDHSHAASSETAAALGSEPAAATDKAAAERVAALRKEITEFFLLERIAEEEQIFATESEVRKRMLLVAAMNQLPVEAVEQRLKETGRIAELRVGVRHDKVREFLRREAKISDAAAPEGASVGGAPGEATTASN